MLINLRHLRAVVLNTFGVCRAVRRFRAAVDECGRWDARVGKRQCAMREHRRETARGWREPAPLPLLSTPHTRVFSLARLAPVCTPRTAPKHTRGCSHWHTLALRLLYGKQQYLRFVVSFVQLTCRAAGLAHRHTRPRTHDATCAFPSCASRTHESTVPPGVSSLRASPVELR